MLFDLAVLVDLVILCQLRLFDIIRFPFYFTTLFNFAFVIPFLLF